MNTVGWQLLTALTGSLGFALLFRLRRQFLFLAALGGLLGWGVYLLCGSLMTGIFVPCLIASAAVEIYAECLARLQRAPSSIFYIPAIIPLIPGSTLFYTMSFVVQRDWDAVRYYGGQTLQFALAIALGMSLIWAVSYMIRELERRVRKGT